MNNRLAAAVIAVVAALVVSVPGAAQADIITKRDARSDAPARLDISSVTYGNGPGAVSARIRIPDLERRGAARLQISKYATDVSYVARVRVRPDGTLQRTFGYVTNTGTSPRRCNVTARWSVVDGYVAISVPHACLTVLKGNRYHYLDASTGDHVDYAPVARHLRRG